MDLSKKKDRDIIMNYLPLDSIEKAFELKSKLSDGFDLNFNSMSLIKKMK